MADHRKTTKPQEDHNQPYVLSPSPGIHSQPSRVDDLSAAVNLEEEKVHCETVPGDITPYIGLRARLTQIPINRWTILLLLVLARLIILFESLDTNLTEAKQVASSACVKVEDMASAMASMPYYLSVGGRLFISSVCEERTPAAEPAETSSRSFVCLFEPKHC